MTQDFKCFIGLHKYEVYKEEVITNAIEKECGKAIISRCANCGKIKVTYISTKELKV